MEGAQDTGEGVVILGWNGIELVIVTACASKSEAEKAFADHVYLHVCDIGEGLFFICIGERPGAECKVAGGDHLFASDIIRVRRQQVAR